MRPYAVAKISYESVHLESTARAFRPALGYVADICGDVDHKGRVVDELKRMRREELLRRLDSTDELIGRPAAGRDPDEDERQQEFTNEVEKEKSLNRGLGLTRLSW